MEHTADGVLLKPLATAFARIRPKDIFGYLSYKSKPKSVEEAASGDAGNQISPRKSIVEGAGL